MPNWKKVIISGSNISQLTNDSGYVLADQVSGSSVAPIAALSASLTVTDQAISASIAALSGSASDARNLLESVSASYALTSSYSHTASYVATTQHSLSTDEVVVNVKNTSGGDISKGVPVYATGVTGDNINIAIASNLSSNTMPAIGVLGETLTANTSGTAVVSGKIIGVDTAGFTAGKNIYVNSDGDFTQTKPTGSSFIQNIGVVGKVNSTDGEILIQGSGRSNDLPNLSSGYAWVGDGDGVPTAVLTSSFSIDTFPYTGSAGISGSLEVDGTASFTKDVTFANDLKINEFGNIESPNSINANGKFGINLRNGENGNTSGGYLNLNSGGATLAGEGGASSYITIGTTGNTIQVQSNGGFGTDGGNVTIGSRINGSGTETAGDVTIQSLGGTNGTAGTISLNASSINISGDTTASGSFSGSFQGDGSQLTNIASSSYALTASYAISSSHEVTHEVSSSYAQTATSASYALTASYALNGGGSSGFPAEYVTANTTAEKGKTYVFEQSTAYTLTLPSTPTNGDSIQISNRSNIGTNVLDRNGELIMGDASDLTLDLSTASFILTYTGGTQGWVIIGAGGGATTGSAASIWYDGGTFISSSVDVRITGSLSMVGSEANFETLQVVLPQISQSGNFADDTAAAIGGIALGGLYRNGNLIAIRLS